MSLQTIQVDLPKTLLERAQIKALDEARELITFLLEQYVQELEKAQRRQAFEAYYKTRTEEEEAEELEVLSDFASTDSEITGETA
jgi:hypothetical protein